MFNLQEKNLLRWKVSVVGLINPNIYLQLTCRKGSLIPDTSCSGEYPEMIRPFMIWTRSGTVWRKNQNQTKLLQHNHVCTAFSSRHVQTTPFWSVSAFPGSARTAGWWAPRRRAAHLRRSGHPNIQIHQGPGHLSSWHIQYLLTVVLLAEEGTSSGNEELSQILDFSYNVYST